jgi:SAM-dependent methyltransferase
MAYENRSYWRSLHEAERGRFSAVGYPELGEGFNRAAYRLRLGAAERLLRRAGAVPLGELLEGAVGIGAYGPLWEKLGVRAWTGLDLSPAAVEAVTRRYPAHRFRVADLTRLDEAALEPPGARFDLVTAIDVLYHLVEDRSFEAALSGLAGRVRPGGLLLVSDVFCPEVRQVAPHVKRRPLAAYQAVLEPLGFRPLDREPVFSLLGDPVRRPERPVLDGVLYNAWRVVAKLVRTTPAPLRSPLGFAVATSLWPLDAVLRGLGVSRGSNLELAAFRRGPWTRA